MHITSLTLVTKLGIWVFLITSCLAASPKIHMDFPLATISPTSSILATFSIMRKLARVAVCADSMAKKDNDNEKIAPGFVLGSISRCPVKAMHDLYVLEVIDLLGYDTPKSILVVRAYHQFTVKSYVLTSHTTCSISFAFHRRAHQCKGISPRKPSSASLFIHQCNIKSGIIGINRSTITSKIQIIRPEGHMN